MKKKVLGTLICITLLMTLMVSCGSSTEEESDSTSGETEFTKAEDKVNESMKPLPDKDTGVELGAIESTLSNQFWVTMQEGYEETAEEYGVTIDVQATDSDTDTTGQLNILNSMITKEYSAIAVSPLTENCLISGIVTANNNDIKIVTTGNQVDADALEEAGGKIDGNITVDFYTQGEMGAEYIVEQNDSKGEVAVIAGNEGATQSDARRDGAKEAFEKAGMDVVAVKQCDFDQQKAYDAAIAIVEANPDIVGIACGNDDMAMGVIQALKEKDMNSKVTVVGVDFTDEGKEAIEDGSYDASVAMSPYLMGRQAVLTMLKSIQGQDVSNIDDSTPIVLVTSSNVDQMSDWH